MSKKTIAEQIADLEATRAANMAALNDVAQKSVDEGRSMDEAEQDEFDDLTAQIKSIDDDLKRLRQLEKLNIENATPVDGSSIEAAGKSRAGISTVQVKHKATDGLAMAQVVKFLGRAQGSRHEALELAKNASNVDGRVVNVLKAAVAAGTTGNSTWAGALVGDESSVYADFLEYLRPQTILGRFGQGGIPALRSVPFRVALIGQTSGGSGYWVGEGKAKPLTKFDFARNTLEPLKVANIAVVTEEVLRSSSPAADAIIRDALVAALRERLDRDFIDPTKAASAGVSPASITNGVTGIPSTGNDADSVRADLRALFGAFIAANNAPTTGVFIMSATTALAAGMMTNPLGQAEFPGLGMNGGTLNGMPVIVSEYVPAGVVVLANASDIYIGDEGGFVVDMSREASLQMDDAPTGASDTPAAAQLVSLWQTNSVGFRAEREINWARRRASAVAYLTGVAWGAPADDDD